MLRAIAIYNEDLTVSFDSAPKKEGFFSYDPLEEFKEKVLPNLPKDIPSTKILSLKTSNLNDYYYLKNDRKENINMLIVSKNKLMDSEATNLFGNILYTHQTKDAKKEEDKVTLNQIVSNPMGYTGRHIKTQKIFDTLDTTKDILQQNIEQLIQRGEKIDDLKQKSIELKDEAIRFDKGAKKLNSCC